MLTSKNYVRTVSVVRLEWLLELAPHYYDLDNWPEGDTKSRIVQGYRALLQEKQYLSKKGSKKA